MIEPRAETNSSSQPDRTQDWKNWLEGKSSEEIANQLSSLESQTEEDHLTGLLNIRGWDRMTSFYMEHIKRSGESASVIFGDIDDFNVINNTLGHDAGDQALIFFANFLKSQLNRHSDILARYGGDEFVMFLSSTDAKGAELLTQRIVENLKIEIEKIEDSSLLKDAFLGISMGFSEVKIQEENSLELAIKNADSHMYTVKNEKKSDV